MQVQPNSTIYLLAGVPIDKSYNYSLYFETEADQSNYFQTKIIPNHGSFSKQQYTRVDRNTLRVAVCADDVLYCNYVMFKNNGTENGFPKYANKWYYAFAKVKYLNEYACEIEYEIDDIQTWMFDYVFDYCFVEREHSVTDVAGDNLQPEPVDTGELVAYSKYEADFTEYMFGAIITNVQLEDSNGEIEIEYGPPAHPVLVKYNLQATFMPTSQVMDGAEYDNSSGIPCGLYIYTGLLCDKSDWDDYFNQQNRYTQYNISYPISSTYPDRLLTCGRLLDAITHSYITGKNLSENNIVSCYIYPAGFNLKSAETMAHNAGLKNGIGMADRSIILSNPFGNDYTPKNNKLKTAPFSKIYVTTETGANGEYRFEFFEKNSDNVPIVKWHKISTYFGQPTATLVPVNYKGKEYDYDDSIVTSPYPVPIYSGDAFQSWWQQSKTSFVMGTITNAITLGLGAISRIGKPHLDSALSSASQFGGNIGSSIGTLIDKSNVPPNSYYQAQNEALAIGTNRTKFIIYFLCVTPEYARKIDSFFDKYGYAVNELKIPNLQRGSTKRPKWNYLKVKNCMLSPDTANNKLGMPSDVEEHLEQIYENGITMWTVTNGSVDVGNYNQTNSI